jgi:DNA-binding GntR family transcriptional regulator
VPPRSPTSQSDTVYVALKGAILNGALGPGAPLREEELGRRHKVSRTPVREALGRLESDGLAVRHTKRGLIVYDPTLDDIIDLYVLREALESLAARLAAERRTELDLQRFALMLDGIQRAMREAHSERVVKLSSEFHFLMWRVAGNRPLQRALNEMEESLQRFRRSTLAHPGRAAEALREHHELRAPRAAGSDSTA